MRDELKRGRIFSRRSLVLGGAQGLLLSGLAARLYQLQIIQEDEYKTLSDSNRIKLFLIPPLRGKILDRTGTEVASNKHYYRILLNPGEIENLHTTLNRLGMILNISEQQKQYFIEKISSIKGHAPILLYDHLSWEEVSKIEINAPDLPGIFVDRGQIRYYPYGHMLAHITGYIGAPSKKELDSRNPLFKHPDFKVGKSGIEKIFDTNLRGHPGIKRIEVNAYGRSVRELSVEESNPGNDLQITLDSHLQKLLHEHLPKTGASAVVIDSYTGNILGLHSTPTFDPNRFAGGITQKEWHSLINNPNSPLINKAIGRTYPPGSIFKIMVALAALKEGVISPRTTIYCPGYVDLGNRRFHCWKEEGHGKVNLSSSIMQSCNTYFYEISKKVGIENIAKVARSFGFGDLFDLELPGETAGLMPNKKWKRKKYNKEWLIGDTLNSAIGQGYILATPLQLAVMTARLITGKKVMPRLTPNPENSAFETLPIAREHRHLVLEGMERVINSSQGTAFGSRILSDMYAMGGKTGTSQVVSKRYKKDEDVSWEDRHHGLFAGFAPVHEPRYVVSVVVEHGKSGSQSAAPIARDLLLAVQKLAKKG